MYAFLRKKDWIGIALAILAFLLLSIISWLLLEEIGLIFSLSIALGILLALQIDIFRRIQAQQLRRRPPESIPSQSLDEYTLGGKIPIESWYIDEIPSFITPRTYRKKQIDSLMVRAGRNETDHYGETDLWLYQALKNHSIHGKQVVILGSATPWYESICLYYGGKCTTIDHKKIISKDPRIKTLTPDEYTLDPVQFDAAFSISSFEHDGLGRYGDPLNPKGDLEAMKKLRCQLKEEGILFLSVPVGKDTIVWNAHRIYGRIRLPMLLEGWELSDTYGFSDSLLDVDTDRGRKYTQPIFVLRNPPLTKP